jgi:apolipoprotein N-acyltransferase
LTQKDKKNAPFSFRKAFSLFSPPMIAGFLTAFSQPPFNHETHWIFSVCPFLSFFYLVPFFYFATGNAANKPLLRSYLFLFASIFLQIHWLAYDNVDGLWHLVLIGLVLASFTIALFYMPFVIIIRFFSSRFPQWVLVFVAPAAWTCTEYVRTLGELGFPWGFAGYTLTPLLPLAQTASLTGVFGLSFIIVMGNTIIWGLIREYCPHSSLSQCARILFSKNRTTLLRNNLFAPPVQSILFRFLPSAVYCFLIAGMAIWGAFRIASGTQNGRAIRAAIIQPNLQYTNWSSRTRDSIFSVVESLSYVAKSQNPDVIISSESTLLSYVLRQHHLRMRLERWIDSLAVPIVFGTLDMQPNSAAKYPVVFNTALYSNATKGSFQPYYKIKLVPFGEALPFKGIFPLLNSVDLGGADFTQGKDYTIFSLPDGALMTPLICFDAVFPDYVRQRAGRKAHLLVNITNDKWFGPFAGPIQHFTYSRMRSIENGISMIRSANSGVSGLIDQYGRIIGKTGLLYSTILVGKIPVERVGTLYNRWGDWPVALSSVILLFSAISLVFYRKKKG